MSKGIQHDIGLEESKSHVHNPKENERLPNFTKKHPENSLPPMPGGSVSMGGSIGIGGGFPNNHIEAYHHVLNLTPQQLELKREIAAQLLGATPSHMWGNLLSNDDKSGGGLQTLAKHYEDIIHMPNVHAMARMLEADHGGGFFKALSHVGRIAANVYKSGRNAAIMLNKFRDPLMTSLGLEQYKPYVDRFASTISDVDGVINPLVEATLAATNGKHSPEQKQKAKEAAREVLQTKARDISSEITRRKVS